MKHLLLLITLLCTTALSAQDEHRPPTVQLSSEGVAGKALFQQRCGFCHGADASGGSGPDLLHSTLVLHDEKGNLIAPVVHGERVDKGMPAFDLSDRQVQQIAEFLHTQIKVAATIFYTNSTAEYSIDKLLVGDANAGQAYFNGPGRCTACHSTTGDLAHIAQKYRPIELQSRLVYPKGAVPTVEVMLPNRESISGKQTYSDSFFISLRDNNGWIRSFDRSKVKIQVRDPLAAHKALLPTLTDKIIHDLFAYLETLK
jgi:cytochrome c oxidase cbb3-type subunit 3